jgi:hypothetical protein
VSEQPDREIRQGESTQTEPDEHKVLPLNPT